MSWVLGALWALGWFATGVGAVAVALAKLGPPPSFNDAGLAPITIIPMAIFLIALWPIVLAIGVGWLLWPIAKKLVSFRERSGEQ